MPHCYPNRFYCRVCGEELETEIVNGIRLVEPCEKCIGDATVDGIAIGKKGAKNEQPN